MRARLLFTTILLPATLVAQMDAGAIRRIDSLFARWSTHSPGCAVGVAKSGWPILTRAYGMANLEYGIALTPESVLESGSVAKQFTSAAIALLQLEGKLSLDDDIRKYLPEVPSFGGQTITIRHLLTHTSGLRDQWGLLSAMGNPPTTQVHTLPLILHLVSRQRDLNFPVGSEYLYSNTGYALAAMIVRRVSGKPLAQFSQERFFQPMGMQHTQWRDDYQRVVPGRATAYERRPDGSYAQLMPFTNVYGNGGLLTTVGDMLIWNEALTLGTIPGGRPLVDLLETRMRLTGGQTIAYALGLVHGEWDGHRNISHSGSTAGYQTLLARLPDDSLSLAVFCNATDANPTRYTQQVAALLVPPAGERVVRAERRDSATFLPFAGRYRHVLTDDITEFFASGNGLEVRGGGVVASTGTNTFRAPNGSTFLFSGSAGARRVLITDSDGVPREYEELFPPPSTQRLAEFLGTFESPELGVRYEIGLDGNGLVLNLPPAAERLVPLYADGFRGSGRTVRFIRDRARRVTELQIFAGRVRALRFVKLTRP